VNIVDAVLVLTALLAVTLAVGLLPAVDAEPSPPRLDR
jgi:hypothetical protein